MIIDPDLYPHRCRWVVDWLSVHFGSDTGLRPPGAGLMVNSAGCPEDAVSLGWAFCAVGRSRKCGAWFVGTGWGYVGTARPAMSTPTRLRVYTDCTPRHERGS